MGGMMDFVMLGIMVLGGAALWVNKDNLGCIFNPSSCGTTGPDCTLEPNAAGCGTDPGGTGGADCGKLCRDKKCTDYKKNCKTGCKYCCGSGTNSPKCSGTAGSQCSSLCSNKSCQTYANQCEGACLGSCTNCNSTINNLKTQITTAIKNAGYQGGCGCVSTSQGSMVACSMCKTCANGSKLCTANMKLGSAWSVTSMMNALKGSYASKHPAGCTTSGGCKQNCSGGWTLNTSSCTCVCNKTCKSNETLIKNSTTCQCKAKPPVPTANCYGYTACKGLTGGACCSCAAAHGACKAPKPHGAICQTCPGGCNCVAYTQTYGASEPMARADYPGPYGDYRFANTGRVVERVRIAV